MGGAPKFTRKRARSFAPKLSDEYEPPATATSELNRRKTPRRASAMAALDKSYAESVQQELDSQKPKKIVLKKITKQIQKKKEKKKTSDMWAVSSSEDEAPAPRATRPLKRKSKISKGKLKIYLLLHRSRRVDSCRYSLLYKLYITTLCSCTSDIRYSKTKPEVG